MQYKKKLIEVALPLEAINEASAREKSIRHGHPSTLHLWWARRPLAAARAVIWSSLVDDPSSNLELFPTEEDQARERERLFQILRELVIWENSNNEDVLSRAKAEIMKSTDGQPPELLDPFAGGGAIPLEAQRLGLKAHASDLNPVAVMINKAMIEIPPRFANMPPVNPEAQRLLNKQEREKIYPGASGLAEDVRYYGEWMKEEAFKRIGHLYPKVKDEKGIERTVIAWIWARTVKCPNPACGREMPLLKTTILSKKSRNEAYIEIMCDHKNEISYSVKNGLPTKDNGTVNRKGAICICCNSPVGFQYIKGESNAGRLSARMIAIVVEGVNRRRYLNSTIEQIHASLASKPKNCEFGELAHYPGYINPNAYGLADISSLFTNRQLTVLSTLSNLVIEVQRKVVLDSETAGLSSDSTPISKGGNGSVSYSQAISVFLSFVIDKMADYHSSICSWHNTGEKISHTFGMTGISMTWDYAEANPFSNSSGCFDNMLKWVEKSIVNLPALKSGVALQRDAQSDIGLRNVMISTDPPYYSNVPYANFSDFFYAWLRMNLKETYPNLFRTLHSPKNEELVADPFRAGSKEKASEHFELGMLQACTMMSIYTRIDIPVSIYYSFKQNDAESTNEGILTSSTGWETMLTAIIKAGFSIVGTWPLRTEMSTRSRANESNALASSIVLVCRKRSDDVFICTRRDFINSLKRELKPSLAKLQSTNIAPVDLAQSAIGPGMGVYSRYSQVLEADGTTMNVRNALQIINQELDLYFTEQDGELDRNSRFCVDLYSQYAFNEMKFGEADVLARAKNTSVEGLSAHRILHAQKGVVRLLTREEIPQETNPDDEENYGSCAWLLTQQLTHAMEQGGIQATAKIIMPILGSIAEQAKALAYRLFTIADRKGWAKEAYAYNTLVIAWPEVQMRAAELAARPSEQIKLDI